MFPSPLQAKYLAQIIVMGAQVVGRAFARAVRQEYAGNYSKSKKELCLSSSLSVRDALQPTLHAVSTSSKWHET